VESNFHSRIGFTSKQIDEQNLGIIMQKNTIAKPNTIHPLSAFMEYNLDDFRLLLTEVSDPRRIKQKDGNNDRAMLFTLECILIISELNNKKGINQDEIRVIRNSLIHSSKEIRHRALFTTLALLKKDPDIVRQLLISLKNQILEETTWLNQILENLPSFKIKKKAYSESFFSLIIILLSKSNDKKTKESIGALIINLIEGNDDNNQELKTLKDDRIKEIEKLLLEFAKVFLPGWLNFFFIIISRISPRLSLFLINFLKKKIIDKYLFNYKLKDKTVSYLIDTYTDKCYPCNIMEMELFLNSGDEKNEKSITIANFYNNSELPNDSGLVKLKNLSEEKNGLISWYIYTIFPYYFYRQDQHEKAVKFLKKLVENGSDISKYSALSALWFSKKYMNKHFAENIAEEVEEIFKENARKFILNHGGWLEIHHSNTKGYQPPKKFIAAIQSHRNFGCALTIEQNSIDVRYDSDILSYYFECLAENSDTEDEAVDDIVSLTRETIKNASNAVTLINFAGVDFLKYALKCIGKMGGAHPRISLKCLVEMYKNKGAFFSEIISSVNLVTEIARSIAIIGRIYPMKAKKAIEEFSDADRELIIETFNQTLEEIEGVSISVEGQSLYQRFMLDENMRKTFANGIITSGTTSKIEKFFLSYTEVLFEYISKIDLKNLSVYK